MLYDCSRHLRPNDERDLLLTTVKGSQLRSWLLGFGASEQNQTGMHMHQFKNYAWVSSDSEISCSKPQAAKPAFAIIDSVLEND